MIIVKNIIEKNILYKSVWNVVTGITHLNWVQPSHTFQRSFALNIQFHPPITNYYDYNYYELSKK